MKFSPMKYSDMSAPTGYVCGSCGASGVKLWREYQTFLDHQTLECGDCACKSQKKDLARLGEDGKLFDAEFGFSSDQIGWRIPAVPTEEGDTFWGYSSVPSAGVGWWKSLPVRLAAQGSAK